MDKKVRFHLPGLRYNFPLNMVLLSVMREKKEFFRDDVEIASFFGEFPTSRWNGGRFSGGDQCDAEFVKRVVASINGQGVPVRFTYTNPLITKEDLKDDYCNFCLEVAHNGMNEVLVVSPILEEYIREKYPKYKINSSTCKEIKDMTLLNEELKKDYSLVVLDYNLNNQFDLLEQIENKAKCEILVNACCVPNCPRRGEHYRFIAKQQETALKNRTLPPNKQIPIQSWHCEYGENNTIYNITGYKTYISPEAIWEKYVPMGFNNFKLEGRTANLFHLVDEYCMYLCKPEKKDEARLTILNQLNQHKIININMPRPAKFTR